MTVCNEDYGCGEEVATTFTVAVLDWSAEEADEEGVVTISVCRDCAATGEWEEG